MVDEETPLSPDQIKEFQESILDFYQNLNDDRLYLLFNLYDRDRNGKISRLEIKTTLNSVNLERVSDQKVDAMLIDADKNKDGVIDKDEF